MSVRSDLSVSSLTFLGFSFLGQSPPGAWEGALGCGFALRFCDDSVVLNVLPCARGPLYVLSGEGSVQVCLSNTAVCLFVDEL